jgi:hypothetical protein
MSSLLVVRGYFRVVMISTELLSAYVFFRVLALSNLVVESTEMRRGSITG